MLKPVRKSPVVEPAKSFRFMERVTVAPSRLQHRRMLRGDQTSYFIAETKSTGEAEDPAGDLLCPLERTKPECGKRHCRQYEEARFRRVASVGEFAR